jgi:hypothetical protein
VIIENRLIADQYLTPYFVQNIKSEKIEPLLPSKTNLQKMLLFLAHYLSGIGNLGILKELWE